LSGAMPVIELFSSLCLYCFSKSTLIFSKIHRFEEKDDGGYFSKSYFTQSTLISQKQIYQSIVYFSIPIFCLNYEAINEVY